MSLGLGVLNCSVIQLSQVVEVLAQGGHKIYRATTNVCNAWIASSLERAVEGASCSMQKHVLCLIAQLVVVLCITLLNTTAQCNCCSAVWVEAIGFQSCQTPPG